MDGHDAFTKHWKLPKSKIKQIKKEYETAKTATEAINPDALVCFKEMAEEVFDFFETLTGKKTNRDVILGHLSYYFEEGFEEEEMKQYISKQFFENEYYKAHPEWFTISYLFPIKDQERINVVWDHLALHQADLTKKSKQSLTYVEGIRLKLKCGHFTTMGEYKTLNFTCMDCSRTMTMKELLESPHDAIKVLSVDNPLYKDAKWLCKMAEESPDEYVRRTYEKRKELMLGLGMKVPPLSTLSKMTLSSSWI